MKANKSVFDRPHSDELKIHLNHTQLQNPVRQGLVDIFNKFSKLKINRDHVRPVQKLV